MGTVFDVELAALVVRPRFIVRMRDVDLPELPLSGYDPERQYPESAPAQYP